MVSWICRVTAESGVAIVPGKGDGTFGQPRVIYSGSVRRVAPGRFNADEYLDLLAVDDTGKLAVLLGQDDGSFDATKTLRVGDTSTIVVGDWDGDRDDDLAELYPLGALRVYRCQGDGTFLAATIAALILLYNRDRRLGSRWGPGPGPQRL